MRGMLIFLCMSASLGFAALSKEDAHVLGEQAVQTMQQFTPAIILPGYTSTPIESQLNPNKSLDPEFLQKKGMQKITENETAQWVMRVEKQRAKITPNDKAYEIELGAQIISQSEAVIRPGCYTVPVPCKEKTLEKTCEEKTQFIDETCYRYLHVAINQSQHPEVKRILIKGLPTLNLTSCKDPQSGICSQQQLIHLHERCEYLDTQVMFKGFALTLVKTPTCSDPTLTVDNASMLQTMNVSLHVVEHWSDEDSWTDEPCSAMSNLACTQVSVTSCLDENQSKPIQGTPIVRRCWGEAQTYQCAGNVTSSCTPLLDAGCSNTSALCLSFKGNHCDVTEKTYRCTEKTCFPDKEVCPPEVLPCSDGSCDETKSLASEDLDEGLGRLGALSEVVETFSHEHAQTSVASSLDFYATEPSIFQGEAYECKEYPIYLRDCCTDKGFLDGILNCPYKMQVLQLAKVEGRAIEVGHYRSDIFGTNLHVFCIFPTKLAGILQTQGRFAQLQIPFGNAQTPDCRGMTPNELERINFKALDLSPLVDEMTRKKKLPLDADIAALNEQHVAQFDNLGASHA